MKYHPTDRKTSTLILMVLTITLSLSLPSQPVSASCVGVTNVANESELNAAIADFNSQAAACSYMIILTTDINLTTSTTAVNNATDNVDLLIDGDGFAVDGQGINAVRPFEIGAGTTVEMLDITITGGRGDGNDLFGRANDGVGIRNNGGTLILTTVTLTDNFGPPLGNDDVYGAWGGGLYNAGGTVTIQNNSVISNNNVEFGGGVYNTDGGTVNIYDSAVTGNTSLSGGGVYHEDGLLVIDGSSFSGNDGSGGGAAIEADDATIIRNSQFTGVGRVGGPSLNFFDDATISNSTISGYDSSYGAVVVGDHLTVINTTISNNSMGIGGGIISFGSGTITVINSTLSNNTSDDSDVAAGGIHMFSGTANIINSTINGNTLGIQVYDNSGEVNISNSLIVNSTGVNCDISGTVNVSGTNFADDDSCTGVTNDSAAGDNLGPLQDNGGPTFTHGLLEGNPAINAGSNSVAVNEDGDPLITDQRGDGFPRIIGSKVDVGAFESSVVDVVDDTAPVITSNVNGQLGDNGWYVSNVEVSWSVSDDESDISLTSGCQTTLIDNDTAGTTLTCEATSEGGTSSESVTIQRDASAPTASATVAPAANANGWHNSDVTVSFSGSDALSGLAGCDADVILSSEGSGQSANGVCTDLAGNVSAPASANGINIDKTAPVVSVTGVQDGAEYILGAVPAAGCDTQDALSGVATAASLTLNGGDTDDAGTITATCDGALDLAGNSGSASVTYTVFIPQQTIGNLQDNLQTLVDTGVLNNGQANGLSKPLNNAIRSLDKGKTADACNQLQDFIAEVNAKTPEPLDGATAAGLIADAEAIRAAIGCQ